MKKITITLFIVLALASCQEKGDKGKFTVNGEIKDLPDQKVYLEELFFSQKDPEVLDTEMISKGKFTVSALAPEQGLYRIRLEKNNGAFIFINDEPKISFAANVNDMNGATTRFYTPANLSLRGFMQQLNDRSKTLSDLTTKLNDAKRIKDNDSAIDVSAKEFNTAFAAYKNYIVGYIDTTRFPVTALFAMGYIRDIDPDSLEKPVMNVATRFPNHQAVAAITGQFKVMLAQTRAQQEQQKGIPHEGSLAPDLTMNDVNDKPFSLHELRGKYVLVDFWASWCGPCRQENPNVVTAYNKYKDKNFTVLGVSLDNDKTAWLAAIAKDKLSWKQISDLKQWESEAVKLYGIDGIPYNVLLDPQGKIIATALRGEDLEATLDKVLK